MGQGAWLIPIALATCCDVKIPDVQISRWKSENNYSVPKPSTLMATDSCISRCLEVQRPGSRRRRWKFHVSRLNNGWADLQWKDSEKHRRRHGRGYETFSIKN